MTTTVFIPADIELRDLGNWFGEYSKPLKWMSAGWTAKGDGWQAHRVTNIREWMYRVEIEDEDLALLFSLAWCKNG